MSWIDERRLKDIVNAVRCVHQWDRQVLPYGWSLSMPGDRATYGREPSGYSFRRHPLGPPRDSLAADGEALGEAWDALMLELTGLIDRALRRLRGLSK